MIRRPNARLGKAKRPRADKPVTNRPKAYKLGIREFEPGGWNGVVKSIRNVRDSRNRIIFQGTPYVDPALKIGSAYIQSLRKDWEDHRNTITARINERRVPGAAAVQIDIHVDKIVLTFADAKRRVIGEGFPFFSSENPKELSKEFRRFGLHQRERAKQERIPADKRLKDARGELVQVIISKTAPSEEDLALMAGALAPILWSATGLELDTTRPIRLFQERGRPFAAIPYYGQKKAQSVKLEPRWSIRGVPSGPTAVRIDDVFLKFTRGDRQTLVWVQYTSKGDSLPNLHKSLSEGNLNSIDLKLKQTNTEEILETDLTATSDTLILGRLTSNFLLRAAADMSADQWAAFEAAALDILSGRNTGVPMAQLPDEARLAAPKAYWPDRSSYPDLAQLNVPQFIEAVYGAEGDGRLGKGFTQADLRKIDPSLYNALQRFPADNLPEGFDFPTLEEWNRRQLSALGLSRFIDDPELRKWLAVAAGRAQRLGL